MSFFNTTSNRDLEREIAKGRVSEERDIAILFFILLAIVCSGFKKKEHAE